MSLEAVGNIAASFNPTVLKSPCEVFPLSPEEGYKIPDITSQAAALQQLHTALGKETLSGGFDPQGQKSFFTRVTFPEPNDHRWGQFGHFIKRVFNGLWALFMSF